MIGPELQRDDRARLPRSVSASASASRGGTGRPAAPCPAPTRARCRVGSWVATPVGQRSVWQVSDWMQPTREHEAARRIAPVGTERHDARDVERRHDLAAGAEPDAVAHADADQRVVHEGQPLAQRHADMVHELQRRRAGAALVAVDDDEVGRDARSRAIALQMARNSQGWPMHSLKPAGLPPDSRRSSAMNSIMLGAAWRRRNGAAGEMQSWPIGTPRVAAISGADLGRRQYAAVARLGALAQLELDHLDLRIGRGRGEALGREAAVRVAAAEIAGADLPDDVAAVFAVVGAEAALAGVMREAAELGALVQRADGVGARARRSSSRRC